jgi:hypothetical protein
MKSRIDFFRNIGRIGAFITLFLSSIVLIFWSYIEVLLPKFSGIQLLGIITTAISILAIDFYAQLKRTHTNEVVQLSHHTIKDSISLASAGEQRIKILRIFASTSEMILPVIKETDLYIEQCKLLLQELDETTGDKKAIEMNRKCETFIKNWEDLINVNKIDKLEIKRYRFVPNHFYIIFDNKHLVFGLYYPTDSAVHSVRFIDPILVESSTISGQMLIEKHIEQFENIFRTL